MYWQYCGEILFNLLAVSFSSRLRIHFRHKTGRWKLFKSKLGVKKKLLAFSDISGGYGIFPQVTHIVNILKVPDWMQKRFPPAIDLQV